MPKLVEIKACEDCPSFKNGYGADFCRCGKTDKISPILEILEIPDWCPLPDAPQEGASQECPQDRCPKCGGLMIDITSGRQALYQQYVNDKTYVCMVCHYLEEGAHCEDTQKEEK